MIASEIRELRAAVARTTLNLLRYCQGENWSGWDPYDGLNSRLLQSTGLFRSKIARLAVTQALKRLPINLRSALQVPRGETPKACALFCSSLIRLSDVGLFDDDALIRSRLDRLLELRSPNREHCCWGYNFDWQGRGFFLPKFEPNIICTVFGGSALLDAYAKFRETQYIDMAASVGHFLCRELNISSENEGICFSYTPFDMARVHNANLLGASFLARLYHFTGEIVLRELALKSASYSIRHQREDGSWPYGEEMRQQWIDSFHTGYNLVSLRMISDILRDEASQRSLRKGLRYYLDNFFTQEGVAKYYHDSVWPIDIHSVAQGIITLCELSDLDERAWPMVVRIFSWAAENMIDRDGYFYYQRTLLYTNRVSYIRWSQAWMLLALSTLLSRLT